MDELKTQILYDSADGSYDPKEHPWIELQDELSVPEEIRYSLDEIRVG